MSTKLVSARDFFGKIAGKYDRSYALTSTESKRRMARLVALLPSKCRVLDLGVGTGRELPALLDAGHEVIGVDVAPEMLALCARRARPIETHLVDFWTMRLPFPDAHFGAVLALHGTLAHPPEDADAALRMLADELARVLAPGGVIAFEVPAPAFLSAIHDDDSGIARAVGVDRSVHEDLALGIAVEARVLSPHRWNAAFSRGFDVHVEAVSGVEQLVVGRRSA